MAITPAQHALRNALRACTTIAEVKRIAAEMPSNTAPTTWKHFAIAAPFFDDELIDRFYGMSESLVAMARNKGLTTEQREALYLRMAQDYVMSRNPDVFRVFGPASRTGRLRADSPAMQFLLKCARQSPSVALHEVSYWLGDLRDATDALRGELAARCVMESYGPNGSYRIVAKRLVCGPDVLPGSPASADALAAIPPQSYRERFLAALAVSPLAAAWLLLDTPTDEQLATLTIDEIAPCFEVPDAHVRQLAVLAARGVQPAGVARPVSQRPSSEAPERPPRRSRRWR